MFSAPSGWTAHDMRKGGHNLWRLAWYAVQDEDLASVRMALNLPFAQALQKLGQHKLITKNGYKRLPPPRYQLVPFGGSVVQFCYNAEYVYVWG